MSFFSRLFGSGKGSQDLDARLERLEKQAEDAAPGYVGSAFNRAGDLALREGRPEQAVDYYGRAIDAFLEDAQREAARGVANKIIRVRPGALRTLCTLTWLDLAAKHEATALLHLRDYVEGAKKKQEDTRAATQIYEMAKICPLEEFIAAVADALDGMDYPSRAQEVRSWVTDGAPAEISDAHELAEACLSAAMRSSERGQDFLDDDEGGAEDEEAEPEEAIDASEDENGEAENEEDEGELEASAPPKKLSRKEKKRRKKKYRWD